MTRSESTCSRARSGRPNKDRTGWAWTRGWVTSHRTAHRWCAAKISELPTCGRSRRGALSVFWSPRPGRAGVIAVWRHMHAFSMGFGLQTVARALFENRENADLGSGRQRLLRGQIILEC